MRSSSEAEASRAPLSARGRVRGRSEMIKDSYLERLGDGQRALEGARNLGRLREGRPLHPPGPRHL